MFDPVDKILGKPLKDTTGKNKKYVCNDCREPFTGRGPFINQTCPKCGSENTEEHYEPYYQLNKYKRED